MKPEADLFVADAGKFIVVQFADQLAVQPILTFGGRVETADKIHQRGLARSRRTHDGNILAALDAEVYAAQGMDLLLGAHIVGLPQVFGRDHAGFRRRRGGGLWRANDFGSCHILLLVGLGPWPLPSFGFNPGFVPAPWAVIWLRTVGRTASAKV